MTRYLYTTILLITLCTLCAESRSSSTAKNHELLTKLGLLRVRAPNSHHKKRLAIESRQHTRSDDSHMFIIKLPPNPHYYVNNRPNIVEEPSQKLPVGFKTNGKPGKIYHWNIPVLKKIASARSKSRLNDDNIIDIKYPESWNDVLDKSTPSKMAFKKHSYYIPERTKKHSFHKYFPGNGKPQSFYVIEKSKKPHYHRLLP